MSEKPNVDDADEGIEGLEEDDRFERIATWLNRQQWVTLVMMGVGIALIAASHVRTGFMVVGSSVILAGLFPVVTGRYRSPFGTLRGLSARFRGAISIALGIGVIALAM